MTPKKVIINSLQAQTFFLGPFFSLIQAQVLKIESFYFWRSLVISLDYCYFSKDNTIQIQKEHALEPG